MGCAGSNPLPGPADPMANGRTVNSSMQMSDSDRPCTLAQKINVDDIKQKIQDVAGSMENLMDETHEKLSSLFSKGEQKTEDAENIVEDAVDDSTSTMPEKPMPNNVIFLTVQETRVIPIGIIDENDPDFKINETSEEHTQVESEDAEKLNDTEEKEDNKTDE